MINSVICCVPDGILFWSKPKVIKYHGYNYYYSVLPYSFARFLLCSDVIVDVRNLQIIHC